MEPMDLSDVYHACMADADFKELRENGSHFVPGDGNPNARVCFVGEAPGAVEDKRRLPFQGPSGNVLNGLLREIGLERDEVFITNVLKYRPPRNRDPVPFEIQASIEYLGEELRAVRPELVVCLGKIPTRAFFPGQSFKSLIGSYNVLTEKISCIITYHPAATLYTPELKTDMQSHFKLLAEMLRGTYDNGRSHRHPPTG